MSLLSLANLTLLVSSNTEFANANNSSTTVALCNGIFTDPAFLDEFFKSKTQACTSDPWAIIYHARLVMSWKCVVARGNQSKNNAFPRI